MEMLSSLAAAHLQDKMIAANKENGNGESDIVDNSDVPDDDAIKMFVGQVPRSMDEEALKDFFEEFGRVYQLNVLRDKNSGVSRGCCFVTFFKRRHALDAQNALHNVKTMPGMHHAIQMKPADTENRNERKIFVGMVSKKLSEEEIKNMFNQFGAIEDCTVLRDDSGISRGCAFVTFINRQMAIVAIKSMHHSLTMEGCSSPLVVKFADSQKDKEHKKIQALQTSLWGLAPGPAPVLNSGYTLQPSIVQPSPAPASGYVGGVLGSPLTMGGVGAVSSNSGMQSQSLALQQFMALQQQQQYLALQQQQYLPQQHDSTFNGTVLGTPDLSSPEMSQLTLMSLLQQQQQSSALTGSLQPGLSLHSGFMTHGGQAMTSGVPGSVPGLALTSLTSASPPYSLTSVTPGLGDTQGLVHSLQGVSSLAMGPGHSQQQAVVSNNNSLAYLTSTGGKLKTPDGTSVKQAVGTEGTNNLFIYHLPQEFSDADLVTTFQPFGTIVSAKVFIDKQTNLSKCFGFVSYTTAESAQAAIQAMNGFQVGTKRLKVQIKKPKDVSKPY